MPGFLTVPLPVLACACLLLTTAAAFLRDCAAKYWPHTSPACVEQHTSLPSRGNTAFVPQGEPSSAVKEFLRMLNGDAPSLLQGPAKLPCHLTQLCCYVMPFCTLPNCRGLMWLHGIVLSAHTLTAGAGFLSSSSSSREPKSSALPRGRLAAGLRGCCAVDVAFDSDLL